MHLHQPTKSVVCRRCDCFFVTKYKTFQCKEQEKHCPGGIIRQIVAPWSRRGQVLRRRIVCLRSIFARGKSLDSHFFQKEIAIDLTAERNTRENIVDLFFAKGENCRIALDLLGVFGDNPCRIPEKMVVAGGHLRSG